MLHCPILSTRNLGQTVLICVALVGVTTTASAADPTGDWLVADGVAKIRVAECNGSMWGAVAWEKIPGGKDKFNPDPAKQSRPTLAMPILLDMKKEQGSERWKGLVYNAKDGKSYESTIAPVGTDQLKIQGCVLGFLCGGETWTRSGPPIPSSPANAQKSSSKSAQKLPPAPKMATGQKTPVAGQPPDIGDICLLPEIASPPPSAR